MDERHMVFTASHLPEADHGWVSVHTPYRLDSWSGRLSYLSGLSSEGTCGTTVEQDWRLSRRGERHSGHSRHYHRDDGVAAS